MHGTVYSNYAINEADLLTSPWGSASTTASPASSSEFAKHGQIVHVDIDASEINKNKAAHIAIDGERTVSPARRPYAALPGERRRRPATPRWVDQIAGWKRQTPTRPGHA